MTKEEAIRILKNFSLCGVYHQLIHMNDTDSEAISMAIKALEQPEPCEDAISRQAVFDEAFEVDTKEYGRIDVVGVDAIVALPPVTPQPKTGHLREQARWIPCSERLPESNDAVLVCAKDYFECELYENLTTRVCDVFPGETSTQELDFGCKHGECGNCDMESRKPYSIRMHVGWIEADNKWDGELSDSEIVIAWMPLPEPYREEGTE